MQCTIRALWRKPSAARNPRASLMDTNVDTALYSVTLRNEAADQADFLIDLGDSFMNEKYYFSSYDSTLAAYLAHRPYYGIPGSTTPLYLVNGNHEGELGWRLNGTSENLALWSVRARQRYYPNPVPDGFYSGSSSVDASLALDATLPNKSRDGYYAWSWGDALLVALDPFWYTTSKPSSYVTNPDEGWKFTLGQAQYAWLAHMLDTSTATYKFIFLHHLVGGNSKDARGGSEAAAYYEWGGDDLLGTPEWNAMRAWGDLPIHDLLVRHDVAAVFHGHDHFYARQELDGVVYQECPQPGNDNFTDVPGAAAQFGYVSGTILGNSGHLRVTVADTAATVEYVRAFRPSDESPSRQNGMVSSRYSIHRVVSESPVLRRWALLSLPVRTGLPLVSRLYPNAVSSAYTYANGYAAAETLTCGPGFWLKFPDSARARIVGIPVLAETIAVSAGWNMIGSLSVPIPVSSIVSVPPGIATSAVFGYGTAYFAADTLRPGLGYWIKTLDDGSNTLAKAAQGSMRDALSLTDQAIAYAAGKVTEESVRGMLGTLDDAYLIRILDCLIAKDGASLLAVANEMGERSMSFSLALQDLSSLLQKIAAAQVVPESVLDDWPEAGDVRRLAQVFSREDVQLYYQIAITSRPDLSLAPDEQTGFTMALLRMLAFKPGGVAPVGNSGQGARAPSASAGRQSSATASSAQAKASVAAPTPVASKVLGAVSQQEWSDWMRSLPVRGLVQQLAFQTELQSWQEGASGASASVVVSMAQYATADNVARLQDALSKHLGRQVKILVETGKVSQSVAAVEARVKQEKQSGAEESIANDDFIKSLQDELGATIVPGSIRPIQ